MGDREPEHRSVSIIGHQAKVGRVYSGAGCFKRHEEREGQEEQAAQKAYSS
jgi:hypothetical protein